MQERAQGEFAAEIPVYVFISFQSLECLLGAKFCIFPEVKNLTGGMA